MAVSGRESVADHPPEALGAARAPRSLGIATAVAVLILDQVNKAWLIYGYNIGAHQPVRLTSFFDVVLAKNTGISYSLLRAHSAAGRWALFGLALAATALLLIWLWRCRTRLTALALGLVIGGALGNAFDRLFYGYVIDFYHFHVARFSWYIFNLADVAICVGVGLLLLEGLLGRSDASAASST